MSITPGTTVRITDPGNQTGHHDKIGTVKVADGSDLPYYVIGLYPHSPEAGFWMRADQVEEVRDGETLTISDTTDEAVSPADTILNLTAEIDRLKGEVATQKQRAERAEERLEQQQSTYSTDMRSIQTLMLEVKEEQSWCDDGWNGVVDRINEWLRGGWEFQHARRLVRKTVSLRGETTCDVEVWVYEDEDEADTDNWKDEDGDEYDDPDEFMSEALADEYRRQGGFDTVEVA